jgi:predicted transcriptional regulator
MDKILSARIDEEIVQKISLIASELKTTKKKVIENAILEYADKIGKKGEIDVLEITLGAWNREEAAEETINSIKSAFKQTMVRHQK